MGMCQLLEEHVCPGLIVRREYGPSDAAAVAGRQAEAVVVVVVVVVESELLEESSSVVEDSPAMVDKNSS